MKNVIHKRAVARRDLVEIYVRYAREAGVGVADCFYAEAEAAFRHLASMPGMGTLFKATNPAFGELRYLPLSSRFKKYLVFYRPVADGVEIARVLHGARDIYGILSEEFGIEDDADDDQTGVSP
jgi:toxin ParE1/3/4